MVLAVLFMFWRRGGKQGTEGTDDSKSETTSTSRWLFIHRDKSICVYQTFGSPVNFEAVTYDIFEFHNIHI